MSLNNFFTIIGNNLYQKSNCVLNLTPYYLTVYIGKPFRTIHSIRREFNDEIMLAHLLEFFYNTSGLHKYFNVSSDKKGRSKFIVVLLS